MKIKKFLISVIIYFIFALVQTSFLVHLAPFGIAPNLIIISVIIYNFIEGSEKMFGLGNALIGGFFLDVFSSRVFGFYILILLALSLLIKFVFKKYVKIPFI
jgi:rod shape-determining protein MreD